jgi:transposase
MATDDDLSSLSRTELIALVVKLCGQVGQLRERIKRLEAEKAELGKQLEEAKRKSKRQAAPFSKNKKKTNPKKPGRKPNQGKFSHRRKPDPEDITRTVDVPIEDERCPHCGGSNFGPKHIEHAYCTDIPEPPPKPEVTDYRIEVCKCRDCGHALRGRHPAVKADQRGATAHRLGERVLATGHALHYGFGVPMRKVPAILHEMTGIKLTQSALQQDALRRAEGEVGDEYERLRTGVSGADRVFTDDTGWRINGGTAWLMGFETDDAVVYQTRKRHRNEEVRELVPEDYAGIMHTDRGRSYDAGELEFVKQQKCVYHIIRSIDEVLDRQSGPAREFGDTLKALLKESLDLWHRYHAGGVDDYAGQAERIKQAIDRHLSPRRLDDADNQRLLDQLGWHHDGGNLLRFLEEPELAEPTNNRAERALRSGVIARKVSQCSKNEAGAHAHDAFKSVTETLRKHGRSMIEGLVDLFRFARTHPG